MLSIYGIVISVAVILCLFALNRLYPKKIDVLWDMGSYVLLFGIAGARIYHVVDYRQYYLAHPENILRIWNGGLGIWGAVIGGLLAIYFYSRIKREGFWENTDMISTVLPLGQAVGRWGNFFNSEIYGKPTSLPWALNGLHPLFFYESLLNFVLFLVLVKISRAKSRNGKITAVYLIGYGLIRFFLEFLRVNPWTVYGLNVAQMISILSIVFAIFIIKRTNQ